MELINTGLIVSPLTTQQRTLPLTVFPFNDTTEDYTPDSVPFNNRGLLPLTVSPLTTQQRTLPLTVFPFNDTTEDSTPDSVPINDTTEDFYP
ncbi:hypothetical protein ACOMHN_066145 [Nucella lapillus]